MQASLLLLTATTFGVDFGYQPMDETDPSSSEYIIQLQPHEFDALQSGMMKEYVSYVPAEARPIGRVKIVVGTQPLPRIVARPTLPRDSEAEASSAPQLAQHLESQPETARGQSPDFQARGVRSRAPTQLRQPNRLEPPNLPAQPDADSNQALSPAGPVARPGRTLAVPPFANRPLNAFTNEPRELRGNAVPPGNRVAAVPGDNSAAGRSAATGIPPQESQVAQSGPAPNRQALSADLPPFAANPGPPSSARTYSPRTALANRAAPQSRTERSVMQPPQIARTADRGSSLKDGPLLQPPAFQDAEETGLVPVDRSRQTSAPPRSAPNNLIAINRTSVRLPPFVNTPHPSRPPAMPLPRPLENSPRPANEPWIPELTAKSRTEGGTVAASRRPSDPAESGREFGRVGQDSGHSGDEHFDDESGLFGAAAGCGRLGPGGRRAVGVHRRQLSPAPSQRLAPQTVFVSASPNGRRRPLVRDAKTERGWRFLSWRCSNHEQVCAKWQK